MKINTSHKSGFTLVEIMIVVAIIGLLAAIAIPNFVKARTNSQMNACIANMKQVDGAKATWALEQKKTSADVPGTSDLFGTAAYIRTKPVCPAGTADYVMVAVSATQVCPTVPATHILP